MRDTAELFFPKDCSHYTDLLFREPSSHAAPTGLLFGLRPSSLTAARQIRTFSSPLLEKTIIHNASPFDYPSSPPEAFIQFPAATAGEAVSPSSCNNL
ncbi:MAG: hypothetical protein IJ599_01600 [Alphaproteobacteria bacterium]|nr:hypothetical protein [Alphaproteobacteria bacterium]